MTHFDQANKKEQKFISSFTKMNFYSFNSAFENKQVEHAIPEQFKSIWRGKGFSTEPTDIAA